MLVPAVQIIRQLAGGHLEEGQPAQRGDFLRHIHRHIHNIVLVLVIGTARQQEGVIRHDLGTLKDAVDALRAFAAVNQKYAVAGGHLDVGTVDVLLDLIGSGGDADGLAEFQCALACGAEVCTHTADIGVGHAGQLTVVLFNKGRGLCLHGGVDVGGFQQLLLDSLALGSGFDAQTDSSLHSKQHKEKCQRGDTAETVKAANWLKEQGVRLFAAVGKENSTLESICDDTIVYSEGRPQELVFYLLIGRILYRSCSFDAYPRFADELKNLAFALAQVRKQADAKCLKYAQDYCKEPYNIWIGSGDLWPTAYSYSMCVLEESQWIRTKSVSSPEFFHGTLELLEDDVCTTLLLTEGPTRAQDERVKEFAARHTKKLTCFDTKEYALPGISDEFRPLLSPVVMAAVLQRISKNIEVITDHSLDIRRYYRKESY